MSEKKLSFEQSFNRLEEILGAMNEGKVSLDESIQLFEEADKLIASCNKKLVEAERKIEMLIKNRNGELQMNGDRPKTEEFHPNNASVFNEQNF